MSNAEHFRGFRRRIVITPSPGRTEVAVEDDYHRFVLVLGHDGSIIRSLDCSSERIPWTTCPGATSFFEQRFTGVPLDQVTKAEDPRQHCTHLYDLLLLATAHRRDETPTQFDIAIPDREDDTTHPEIWRNGELLMRWTLKGETILAPPEIAGGTLAGLRSWREQLPEELREPALLLRRVCWISLGRTPEVRAYSSSPEAMASRLSGACYTYQPENFVGAQRPENWPQDFSNRPEDLLGSHALTPRDVGNAQKTES